EGINNLVKHANASEAVIQMNKENGVLNLLVIDNGRGFDYRAQLPGGSKTHGFGLSGIAERVKILRGELQIHSSKKGTRLKIKIPTSWQV
ncbi:MAG: sensor histidine kinase, partial [bacterium]